MGRDTALAPPPHRTPMVDDNGYISPAWLLWFARSLIPRVGNATAMPHDQLEALVASIDALPRYRPEIKADPELPDVISLGPLMARISELESRLEAQAFLPSLPLTSDDVLNLIEASRPPIRSTVGAPGSEALESDATWTPTVANLTIVGVATYVANSRRIGNVVFWSIKITSTVSTAATAGSTTFTLPSTPALYSNCFAADGGSGASYGVGLCNTDGKAWTPTWGATANVTLSGFYFAA